jgi:hypothetical protein
MVGVVQGRVWDEVPSFRVIVQPAGAKAKEIWNESSFASSFCRVMAKVAVVLGSVSFVAVPPAPEPADP